MAGGLERYRTADAGHASMQTVRPAAGIPVFDSNKAVRDDCQGCHRQE
jgi:hypothetical protein